MPITIVDATVTDRIQERLDTGDYADATEVLSCALDLLEIQDNLRKIKVLVDEAAVAVAEHGAIPWTPTFWDELEEEARAMDPTAPLPEHLRP